MDGPIKKGKTSFSLNVGGMDSFDTETIRATNPDGTTFDGVVSPPTDRINFNARVEHAINKNQMLRVEYSRNNNDQEQLGVGGFDLYERAYDRCVRGNEVRISTSGPVFRKMRNEVRLEVDWNETVSTSLSDDRTIRVQDAFTSGGAQIAGGRKVEDHRVRRQPRLLPRQEARAARRRARRRRLATAATRRGTSTAPTRSPRTTPSWPARRSSTRCAWAIRWSNTSRSSSAPTCRTTSASRRTCW